MLSVFSAGSFSVVAEGVHNLNTFLSEIWTFFDTISNFFSMIHDSFVSAVTFISSGFDTVSGFMSGIPILGGLAALILALGLVLLVLGR